MSYNLDSFKKGLENLKISLSDQQISRFIQYYELLIEWNKVMNLTAITEFEDVIQKHFLDSLSIVKAVNLSSQSVIDVGTGAGFPGIPLKIAFPDLEIVLLDSLNKRVNFLNTVIETLQLEKIKALHGRAEDFAMDKRYREKFDLCVSRAVANMTTLSEYCLPFVRMNGKFVSYKADNIAAELTNAEKAVEILGGKLKQQIYFNLSDTEVPRNLLVFTKNRPSPEKYPRKAGLPGKSPIH